MLNFLKELEEFFRLLRISLENAEKPIKFPLYLVAVEQIGVGMFRYKFSLPPVNPVNPTDEVVNREITKLLDGNSDPVILLLKDALLTDWLSGDEGQTLRVELRDIDNAGNKADPLFLEFVVTDTVAPIKAEGGIGIDSVEEV